MFNLNITRNVFRNVDEIHKKFDYKTFNLGLILEDVEYEFVGCFKQYFREEMLFYRNRSTQQNIQIFLDKKKKPKRVYAYYSIKGGIKYAQDITGW